MNLPYRHYILCGLVGMLGLNISLADETAQPPASGETASQTAEAAHGTEAAVADMQAGPERRSSWDNPATSKRQSDEPAATDEHAAAQGLLLQAMSLIGVKYKYGGKDPESGLDCSGFVRYVFQSALNVALPHNALAMSRLGVNVEQHALQPGDLVFFNTLGRAYSHVGIYLGEGRFIHAPRAGRSVEVESIRTGYWQKRWNGARRISGEGLNVAGLLASAGQPATVAAQAANPRQCRNEKRTVKGKTKTVQVCSGQAAKPASHKKRR